MQSNPSLPPLSTSTSSSSLSSSRPQSSNTFAQETSSSSSHPNSNSALSQEPYGQSNPPFLGKVGPTGDPALAKRRAKNLLRDYYGLGSSTETTSPSRSDPGASNAGDKPQINSSIAPHAQQALSIDSPHFDVDAVFNNLITNSSVKSLISTANGLMSDISALESERQSLVYNHHHELVEASGTIDKMKSNSQKLDGTLAQLQDSFSVISELSTTLTSSQPPRPPDHTIDSNLPANKRVIEKFESGLHLSALLSLPAILRGLVTAESKAAADQLWGQWEPALRSLEEAGIQGAKQIGNEAREVLRNAKSST